MTRLAYGDAASDERPAYTLCDNCGRALCVDCLERVADKLDTFADRAVSHDVLHAMAARAWRQRELVGRVRGFEPRRGGGGTWRAHCPLCFDVRFSKPEPPLPRTLSGRPYMDMPPLLVRHVRRLVHARIVLDSGRWSDVLAHTVELYVWAQLVGDGEAREAFQRSPAQGQFAVFWQPPRALAGTTGLVLRVHISLPFLIIY